VLPHSLGVVLSIAVLIAMFGVATRKSLKALKWLRVILWAGVIKILVVQLWLLAQGQIELASYIPHHVHQRVGCDPGSHLLDAPRSRELSG